MKYAYYPGCVAKSTAPELYNSTALIAQKLGIELVELTAASCCGAGVTNEGNSFLNTVLNARTFAMAENMGLNILTICSTCQGVMRQVQWQLDNDPKLFGKTNEALAEINMKYQGRVKIKHLLWALIEDYGLDKLVQQVVKPLKGLKIAPFYGCYILRPVEALQYESHEKPTSFERLITALGGEPVEYDGKTKCCGFPILFVQRSTAFEMASTYLNNARQAKADLMVTPCPLCHISLDLYQKKAQSQAGFDINLPVIHLSQMVGYALGLEPEKLGFSKHMISTAKVLREL
ncbi:MAG TPA: CoB--CoM heterodisulfide reductase iron-sulfur subunit B family protein [Candidatus Bathyarchaeia archaeon]|nr:CoB--CoM heterodisulfide reductase iron-sulfur subunit B family protein [Candidatus Bathyarchaeia archaeon]